MVASPANAIMSSKTWKADSSAAWKAILTLLGAGAIYLGIALLVGYAAKGTTFGSPSAEVWRSLIAGQGVIWAATLALNWSDLMKVLRSRPGPALGYAAAVVAALSMTMVAPKVFSEAVFVLPKFEVMGDALGTFVFWFVLVGLVVAALIAGLIGDAFATLRRQEPTYVGLMEIRQRLQRCTATLSVILVAAIGATSWLQRSLEAAAVGSYPREIVFSYGLYFTALLLVVYMPATAEFYRAAGWLVDAKFPMSEFDKDQAEKRGALQEELGITKTDALQAAVATLSPIIGAVLSMALGKD
jgi:hypothetical protein